MPGAAPRLHSSVRNLVFQVGPETPKFRVCPEGSGREINHQSGLPSEGQRPISIHSPTISPEPGGSQVRIAERALEADQANGPILQMGRLRLRGDMRVQAHSFIGQLLAPHWGLSLLGGS